MIVASNTNISAEFADLSTWRRSRSQTATGGRAMMSNAERAIGRIVERKQSVPQSEPKEKVKEKRSSPRLPPSTIPDLKSVRLVAGPEVTLINISRGGALIETDAHLVPHSSVAIRLVAADAVFLLHGKVLRSRAFSFQGSSLLYQSAIAFEEELPLLAGYQNQSQANETPEEASPQAGEEEAIAPQTQPAIVEEPAVLTIDIPIPPWGPDLRQIFGLNNW
jgi:hypothetical protein